ncbi:MAG: hypothetical protein ACREDG_07450, partial [Methylocella sp.]
RLSMGPSLAKAPMRCTALSAQTHKPGRAFGGLDRTKKFHVKHFGKIGAKNLPWPKTRQLRQFVRSIDFLVQFAAGRWRRLGG